MSDNPNTPAILTWGSKIREDFNLPAFRREFLHNFANISDATKDDIIAFIRNTLGITDFDDATVKIIHKTIPSVGLKWHIDDCQINNRKEQPTYNLEQYILLEQDIEKGKYKYLYFNTPTKRLPRFTILFYSSTYGVDFTGGVLCLSDGVQVFPKAGYGFMLDSREVHMVTPVKSGIRNVSVVKIY